MSSQLLKLIAVVMLIGSVMLAVLAWRLAHVPAPSPVVGAPGAIPPPPHPVVVVSRNFHASEIITRKDVRLAHIAKPPPNALKDLDDAVGKTLVSELSQGDPILPQHLIGGNPLAQSLHEGERAIAIKVDEIIGVGGFIQPGDRVDVVAYLRTDAQRIKESQASIVLHAVRVLAYGEELSPRAGDKPTSDGGEARRARKGTGTAIIALEEEKITRLVLAENAGNLRLALYPLTGDGHGQGPPYPVTLGNILAPAEAAQLPAPKGPMVQIYHGSQPEQIQFQ
ncbi:MAG TPA: Flp pilus assembly protein CpaB [Methylococcaceae bacterium]|nr:Flp pilus assembly protein CpaB [Methylococcaceae bacterium]